MDWRTGALRTIAAAVVPFIHPAENRRGHHQLADLRLRQISTKLNSFEFLQVRLIGSVVQASRESTTLPQFSVRSGNYHYVRQVAEPDWSCSYEKDGMASFEMPAHDFTGCLTRVKVRFINDRKALASAPVYLPSAAAQSSLPFRWQRGDLNSPLPRILVTGRSYPGADSVIGEYAGKLLDKQSTIRVDDGIPAVFDVVLDQFTNDATLAPRPLAM